MLKALHRLARRMYYALPRPVRNQLRAWNLDTLYNRVKRLAGVSSSLRPGGAPARLPGTNQTAAELCRPYLAALGRRTVICFPIIDWHYRFQRPQQLLLRLAAEGFQVIYVDICVDGIPYFKQGTPLERWSEVVSDNVTRVKIPVGMSSSIYRSVLKPAEADRLSSALLELIEPLQIGDATLLVELPFWTPVAQRLQRELGASLVYDCLDDLAGFDETSAAMLKQEDEIIAGADLVAASAAALMKKVQAKARRTVLVPNGCDPDHFATAPVHPEIATLPKPVIGYFGAISHWFDPEFIRAAAEAFPTASIAMIGSASSDVRRELAGIDNIHWFGERNYTVLPQFLAGLDVCVMPFRRIPLTLATNPVKLFEYFSAGKPVVSTRLPEVEPFAPLVQLAETSDEFVAGIKAALNDPADFADRRRQVARTCSWTARARTLLSALAAPRVSIIIVTWNNWDFTQTCLKSVLEYSLPGQTEVIVIDNGSTDATRVGLYGFQCQHPNMRVVFNDTNRGFAAANNQGLGLATGDILVLLNNDTIVTPGWLSGLCRWLDDPKVGLVGPVTNSIGNEARIETDYQDLTGMLRCARGVRSKAGQGFDIAVLAMYCVAMRREVFEKVGLLDERFGVGMFEDDDYSERMRQAGYRVVCAEDMFIHHFGNMSFKKLKDSARQEIFERNQKLFEAKWGRPWVPHKYRDAA
jgi:GT2 family glycosyltransferase